MLFGLLQTEHVGIDVLDLLLEKGMAVATFFNTNRLILVSNFRLPFNLNAASDLYHKPKNCLITVLQPVEHPDKLYLVANTHLYFSTNRGDTKMAMLKLLTEAVALVRDHYQAETKKQVLVFVCGDFNAAPRSGIYEFMRTGEYDCQTLSRNNISGQYHGTFKIGSVP